MKQVVLFGLGNEIISTGSSLYILIHIIIRNPLPPPYGLWLPRTCMLHILKFCPLGVRQEMI